MSIFGIAYSGLNAFQRALDVTANNISNAQTLGYSRQSLRFSPTFSQSFAGSHVGSGVNVDSIYRNVDQFANAQVRNTQSIRSQYDAFYQQAVQIDKLLSSEGSSISSSLQSFFDSIGKMNNAPDGVAARGVFLKQGELLVNQFNTLQNQLDEYQHNSTAQISESVTQINLKTASIAELNRQLLSTSNSPELLDHRDQLIKELSQFIDITYVDQGDGSVNISTSSGGLLVAGTVQRNMYVGANQSQISGTKIYLGTGVGSVDITNTIEKGSLGGLLDYENDVLGKSSQLIGQMAIGLSQQFNAQHQLGLDLNNQLGKAFFTDFNNSTLSLARSVASTENTGTGALSVTISNISQTKLADYELLVTDAGSNQISLVNKADGSVRTINWSSSPPAPPAGEINVDGMTISIDDMSHLNNNDRFTLSPTRGAARELVLQISDIREIALASPVKVSASLNNSGTGQIALGSVIGTAGVDKQYRIDFISETQYNIVNVTDSSSTGPLTFTPNTSNTIQIPNSLNPSYSISISGIPKTGDQFTADFNTNGAGDNRNGLGLAGLQQAKMFSNGSEGIFERYANLLAQVGSQTNQAKLRFDSADILYKQAVDTQDSKSGINLDEEGANLLRFKQAYEAAGKVLEVSSQMLNVLFDIMR